jgi:hypothetical protein
MDLIGVEHSHYRNGFKTHYLVAFCHCFKLFCCFLIVTISFDGQTERSSSSFSVVWYLNSGAIKHGYEREEVFSIRTVIHQSCIRMDFQQAAKD